MPLSKALTGPNGQFSEPRLARLGYQPLSLDDRELLLPHLTARPPLTSELTYTNLFIWRQTYHTHWKIVDGCLLLVQVPEDHAPFGLPPVGLGDRAGAVDALLTDLETAFGRGELCRVGQDVVDEVLDPGRHQAHADRDHSDYVYLAEDLRELRGNKFHRKKNHFNKFQKSYQYEYQPLDERTIQLALEMQAQWCELKSCEEDPGLAGENQAILEALLHFDLLELSGGCVVIDGGVRAFTFGEYMAPDTGLVHVEKADPELNGGYVAINTLFVQNAFARASYINREQDLGLEGLRKAKLSWNPDHLVEKYRVTRA